MDLEYSVNSLKAASDPTRLRLLALLAAGESMVGELQEVLDQSQPRVSRHLRILAEGGLADSFRDGQNVYYCLPADPSARAFVSVLIGRMPVDEPVLAADRDRMVDVRRKRARSAWSGKDALLATAPRDPADGGRVDGLTDALAELPDQLGDVLDVGSGTGTVLCQLARRADRVTGVDISPAMRVVARTRVREAGFSNCTLRQGDMHELPLEDSSFDTVLLDQVLSLTDRPRPAIREAARVLKPDGLMLILDRVGMPGSTQPIEGLAENQLAVMLAESGLRLQKRHELPGRLPGFALLSAVTTNEL